MMLVFVLVAMLTSPPAWSDEFDGTALDSTTWVFDIGTGAPLVGWGNNELQTYTTRTENVFVRDGHLHIRAIRESYEGMEYTSGRIKTKGRVSFQHGRFDVRAKMPVGQGLWPAIWLLSTESKFGPWPRSGEIDLMEYLGHEPNAIHGTVHFGEKWPSTKRTQVLTGDVDYSADFHVYSLEWTPESLTWSVDGEVYHVLPRGDIPIEPYPFDEPFYLILNVAVGGNWPGNPDSSTTFPQEMVLDYVRYTPLHATD